MRDAEALLRDATETSPETPAWAQEQAKRIAGTYVFNRSNHTTFQKASALAGAIEIQAPGRDDSSRGAVHGAGCHRHNRPVVALAISVTVVDATPFSTVGALVVANTEEAERAYVYRGLLLWGDVMACDELSSLAVEATAVRRLFRSAGNDPASRDRSEQAPREARGVSPNPPQFAVHPPPTGQTPGGSSALNVCRQRALF